MTVRWMISVYDRAKDTLVAQHPLAHVHLDELRRLLGEPKESPLYASYPLAETVAEYFRSHYGLIFHFEKYEYFLECERS